VDTPCRFSFFWGEVVRLIDLPLSSFPGFPQLPIFLLSTASFPRLDWNCVLHSRHTPTFPEGAAAAAINAFFPFSWSRVSFRRPPRNCPFSPSFFYIKETRSPSFLSPELNPTPDPFPSLHGPTRVLAVPHRLFLQTTPLPSPLHGYCRNSSPSSGAAVLIFFQVPLFSPSFLALFSLKRFSSRQGSKFRPPPPSPPGCCPPATPSFQNVSSWKLNSKSPFLRTPGNPNVVVFFFFAGNKT